MKTCKNCSEQDQDRFYTSKTNICKSCHIEQELTRQKSGEAFIQYGGAAFKGVYAIFNGSGILQYIGESFNVPQRLYSHFHKSTSNSCVASKVDSMEGWTHKILWKGSNDLKRKVKETVAIRTMQPPLNKLYKDLL